MPSKRAKKSAKTQVKDQQKENQRPEDGLRRDIKQGDTNTKRKESDLHLEDMDEIDGFNNFDKFFLANDTGSNGGEAFCDLEKLEKVKKHQESILQFQKMIQQMQLETGSDNTTPSAVDLLLKDSRPKRKVPLNVSSTYKSPFDELNVENNILQQQDQLFQDQFCQQMEQGFSNIFKRKKEQKSQGQTNQKVEESKASDENQTTIAPDISPKSRRQMMWELEDSYSDSQTSAAINKDDEQLMSQCDSEDYPDTLLCLICNQGFDSPEATKKHVLQTTHESFEMVNVETYSEEMKESLFSFQRDPDSDEWLFILKREFKIIFQLELEEDQELFNKSLLIFKAKIIQAMTMESLSLFENIALKAEIFEFIQAQKKIFKCHSCDMPAFETIEELKDHIRNSGSQKTKKPKKKGKRYGNKKEGTEQMVQKAQSQNERVKQYSSTKESSQDASQKIFDMKEHQSCAFTDAQIYLYKI